MSLKPALNSNEKQTVYYEGGRITALTAQPGVFVRLYRYKKGRPSVGYSLPTHTPAQKRSMAISTQSTPDLSSVPPTSLSKVPSLKPNSPSQQPSSPLIQPSFPKSTGPPLHQTTEANLPFAYIVLKTPPEDYITPRPCKSRPSQTVAVLLTDDLRDFLSLQLRAIQPEVPDRMSAGQVYQRLLAKKAHKGSHMRLVTEPIITPHYVQLSPAFATYSYPAGCSLHTWQHRISLQKHS